MRKCNNSTPASQCVRLTGLALKLKITLDMYYYISTLYNS